jgi:Flp pilus assembly protein TadB
MATPKKMNPKSIMLIGAAGLVMAVTALATGSSFSMILAVGLIVGAFTMWLQARAVDKLAAEQRRDDTRP